MLDRYFTNPLIRKATLLHLPLLLCLYVLTDNDSQRSSATRHLAVFTALSRHPPSMRVFRGLFVICLLGFCSAAILTFLERTVGRDMLERLFFSTPYTLFYDDHDDSDAYELTKVEDEGEDEDYGDEEEEDDGMNNHSDENYKDIPLDTDHKNTPHGFREVPANRSPAYTICSMTLDLLLFILVTLFLFTISSSAGGKYTDQKTDSNQIFAKLGDIAAPTFPLILFFLCAIKALFPWNQRKLYFWTVVSYTLGAPMYDVQFRDGFLGDIFTSMVRPMQDVAFTSFYLLSGLQGWWIYHEQTSEENMNLPVEKSWLLHTVVLPACTVSPLWWRFCQCLRQCYDTKKRWPYLGNAAKYFFAAQVAMFGVFDPEKTGSAIWILAFVCATLYQLWWDVFLDWELLEWIPGSGCMGGSYHLRRQRLYKAKSLYFFIFIVNAILRFGWAMIVMPTRYLSPSGALLNTFSTDFPTLIAPVLACAEVVRRSLWGLLRVELEVIKIKKKEDAATYYHANSRGNDDIALDNNGSGTSDVLSISTSALTPMPMNVESAWGGNSPVISTRSNFMFQYMSAANDVQILVELCIYATIFTAMGVVAAIHRQVM